ncbi:MAG TPA: hypothetical protein VML75_02175 [Kofleriaceae bacterium]|nr:hypothetical protein [Kofleriaceae bacterium]
MLQITSTRLAAPLTEHPQWRALAFGKTASELRAEGTPAKLAPHRSFEGNRPSNTSLVEQRTPNTLGALVALCEHSAFVQGVILKIDSFDQWGVEHGNELAKRTTAEVASANEQQLAHDISTNTLFRRYRQLREPRA